MVKIVLSKSCSKSAPGPSLGRFIYMDCKVGDEVLTSQVYWPMLQELKN